MTEPNGPRAYVCHPEHTEAVAPVLGIPGRRSERPYTDDMVVALAQEMLDQNHPEAWASNSQSVPFHHFATVALAWLDSAGLLARATESPGAASPVPSPSESPEPAHAAILAGGAGIPDAAVEAAARVDHAAGRLPDEPSWDELAAHDADSYRDHVRLILAAAQPWIAAAALRDAANDTDGAAFYIDPEVARWLRDRADELEAG